MAAWAQRAVPIAAACGWLLLSAPAFGWVISEDELEDASTDAGVVARSFAFLMAGEVLAPPYAPQDTNPLGIGLFDARLYFSHRTADLKLVAHEQLSLRMQSAASLGLGALGRGSRPPRWLPLTFADDQPTLTLESDVDWLYAAHVVGPITLTAGRQPITLGRGQIWHTTDRVSTFALTEVDTEYKPGADALRLDIAAAERSNITVVGSVGERESAAHDLEAGLDGSSIVAQARQGWQGGEAGLLGGMVRGDAVVGVDAVLDLDALSLYAELTATWLTAESLPAPAVEDRDVPVMQALLGATIRASGELTVVPEVLYSDFGSWQPRDYLPIALSSRVGIGEQQGLGKLYAGMQTDWEAHPLTHVLSGMLSNLHDPSALVLLGVRQSIAADVDGVLGAYTPVGRLPDVRGAAARSEYGSYPTFFFFELKGTL